MADTSQLDTEASSLTRQLRASSGYIIINYTNENIELGVEHRMPNFIHSIIKLACMNYDK